MATQFYRIARQEYTCEICGKKILVGEQYYIRDGAYSTIRCINCHSEKLKKWEDSRHSYDLLGDKVLDQLFFSEITTEDQLIEVAGNQKTLDVVLKRLTKDGYTIVSKNETYTVKGVPTFSSFVSDLINSDPEDYDEMYNTYKRDWYWIAKQILQDNCVNSPRCKNCADDFKTICLMLKCYNLTKYTSGAYYYSRISEDKKIYEDVCRDNREYVLLFLIEEIFNNCSGITNNGFGEIEYQNQKKTYSIMLDESQINNESGCDYDILITDEGVDCFTDDDVVDFRDCFNQNGNETVNKMLNYIQNLLRSGF